MKSLSPRATLTHEEWNAIKPALEREDDYLVGDMQKLLGKGLAQAWGNGRSAVITEIITHPRSKVLNVWAVGGIIEDILEMEPKIEAWAKTQGCTKAQLSGRPGWDKVLKNWNKKSIIMKRSI
mgnify:CR=1 FL=1